MIWWMRLYHTHDKYQQVMHSCIEQILTHHHQLETLHYSITFNLLQHLMQTQTMYVKFKTCFKIEDYVYT